MPKKEERMVFFNEDIAPGASADELARAVLQRLGLCPRKKGSTDHMHKVLLELYEKQKQATQMKDPALALLSVDEMAMIAKITPQTMYDYLGRWLQINLIQKISFMDHNRKLIVGYRLHGSTLEDGFQHVKSAVNKHLDMTETAIQQLQKTIKNEKISSSMAKKR